jgi:hypothetical protein
MTIRATAVRWLVAVSLALLFALSLAVASFAQPAQAATGGPKIAMIQDDDDGGGDDDDGNGDDDGGVGQVPRGGVDTGAGGTAAAASALPWALSAGVAALAGMGAALWRRVRSDG